MVDVWARLEPHLASVQKPARYIGCELGAEVPAPAPHRVGWLLVYPDTYEVGLPNQGLQILYEILNERPDAVAERSYAPWTDLHEVMRREDIPLFSVDTHRSADEFDVLAFNLSYLFHRTEILREGMERLMGWTEAGRIQAPPVKTFPLERVADAHRALESGSTVGKLVLFTSAR